MTIGCCCSAIEVVADSQMTHDRCCNISTGNGEGSGTGSSLYQ